MFRSHRFSGRLLALLLALLLLWTAAACTARPAQTPAVTPDSTPDSSETPDAPQASDPSDGLPAVEPLAHKQLLHLEDAAEPVTASVAPTRRRRTFPISSISINSISRTGPPRCWRRTSSQ